MTDQPLASDRIACASCRHDIDAVAKLCPYCGADPRTGEKPVDTKAVMDEVFHPRSTSSRTAIMEFARQRQGVVVTVAALLAILVLAAIHSFVTQRNARDVSAAAAIPLTEVTDVNAQEDETRQLPMPNLQFQFTGNPKSMRTFVVEAGAVPPPEVVAAQQQAGAQQQAAARPGAPPAAPANVPRPAPQQPQPPRPH